MIPLLTGGGSPLEVRRGTRLRLGHRRDAGGRPGHRSRSRKDYLEASDPQDFADEVAAVLGGERPDLRRSARELADSSYSIESLQERLRAA